MSDIFILYATFPSKDEALKAATALVENRLAACANVYDNITSVYRWEGKVQQAPEAALVAKTTRAKLDAAIREVKRLHSYEVPCIIAYPISDGFPPFLQWVAEEVGNG